MVVDTGRTESTNLVKYPNARWDWYSLMAKPRMSYVRQY